MAVVPEAHPVGRQIKGLTGTPHEDLGAWPTPDEGALSGDSRRKYLCRKRGVAMYLAGEPEDAIRGACDLGLKHIYRLITERCLEIHSDGLIYGWRGLVPNAHIRPYKRKSPVKIDSFGYGAAGAMETVLDLHPDLRKAFEKRILTGPKADDLGASKRPRQAHWKWFLNELRKLGYEVRGEWPFNTENNGYNTVCRYIDQVLAANPKKAVRAIGGPSLEKKILAGDGVDRPVWEVFQRVEMDAHKIDGRFCVALPQPTGGYIEKIVHRLWVIVIIEVTSKAVLAYFLSLRREVSKEDVLRTIKRALSRWHPRKLSFSEVAYRDNAGFPSNISEEFLGVCWGETSVDGALAETCHHVRNMLKDVVGAELIDPSHGFSSRRSMDDRPFIEAFFKKLASGGFQRMTNTTGGKPEGKYGRDPAKIAVSSRFQFEYAEELLDALVANYNATPHTSLGNRSPLEYLKFVSSRGDIQFRHADPTSVQKILSYRKKCMVRGGLAEGRRPYVNFVRGRYSNEILGQRYDLVGSYIWVVNHLEDDARVAEASTLSGASLGIVRAAPPWHKLPHSLTVRQAISSCLQRRMFTVASGADAVEAFLEFCEQQNDRKLPIHPAYLEARRILVQEAEASVSQSMLELAMSRQQPREEAGVREKGGRRDSTSTKAKPEVTRKSMPARRMAASD